METSSVGYDLERARARFCRKISLSVLNFVLPATKSSVALTLMERRSPFDGFLI